MQHEGHALAGAEPVQHHLQGDPDRLGQGDLVGRVHGRVAPTAAPTVHEVVRPEVGVRQRRARSQAVEAQAAGHGRQPAGEVLDLRVGAVQPQPGLLHDVLGLARVAEHPARHGHQAWAFGLELLGPVHDTHPLIDVVSLLTSGDPGL